MTLLTVHAAATWFMVGLIWMVQVVHYPLFAHVGTDSFTRYERGHTRRIGGLLAGPALVEIVTAAALVFARPDSVPLWFVFAAGALLVAVWVMTAVVQAPAHGVLTRGYDEATIARLVSSNWWRTAGWTLRGVLVGVMLIF